MRPLVPTLLLTAFLAGATGLAGEIVHFTDGRSLEVERVQIDGGFLRLALGGGGEISVPGQRVARWERVRPEPVAALEVVRRPAEPWRREAGPYADLIGSTADRYRLDPALLAAVAKTESAFDPRAVSPKGAGGLLQLMPMTAERFGVEDVFDAHQNVDGGARYLSWLLERFDGRTDLALAGYNAGEGAVDRHRGIPPYRETQRYVRLVLETAGRFSDSAR